MQIGVPRECKPREGRVALCPDAVGGLVADGHTVYLQHDAGIQSGHEDAAYAAVGARVVPDAASLYGAADLIIKVKEPVAADLQFLESRHILFSFLHLAAEPELFQTLCRIGLTACAFETVTENGSLPLLAPMSAVAGRVAVQVGANLLHAGQGGRGILLGGIDGALPGCVVVLGCGVAGTHALQTAVGLEAAVTALDISQAVRARVAAAYPQVNVLEADPATVAEWVPRADLLVGAALVPGARAPVIVSEALVQQMQPGAVIVDIAVDQGGCIATTRPTTYENPTYIEHGVVHMAVTNMPGAVPRTSSQALSAALLPRVRQLLRDGPEGLPGAVNVQAGQAVHPAVRAAMEDLTRNDTMK